jgi:quinol monooxygenase YgiN
MTIARIYHMHAKDGRSAELETGLRKLIDLVMGNLEGCRGVELLRDMGNERRFMFIERWDSEESHKAGAAAFAKLDLGSLMAALDGPPEGGYFDSLAAR